MLGENKKYTRCYTDRPADDKDKERASLQADIDVYLASGNKIQMIPVNYNSLQAEKSMVHGFTPPQIKSLRAKMRITQSDMANRLGLGHANDVSALELGVIYPTPEQVDTLRSLDAKS